MNRIRQFSKILYSQSQFYLPFITSLFINGLIWLLIIWRLPASTTWIPLHFSSYFGIDWIGPWVQITYYPLIGLAIIILNFFLASMEYNKNRQLAFWLIWTGFIVQLFILTSLIFLIINYFS